MKAVVGEWTGSVTFLKGLPLVWYLESPQTKSYVFGFFVCFLFLLIMNLERRYDQEKPSTVPQVV